jgi:hypothetical protein
VDVYPALTHRAGKAAPGWLEDASGLKPLVFNEDDAACSDRGDRVPLEKWDPPGGLRVFGVSGGA